MLTTVLRIRTILLIAALPLVSVAAGCGGSSSDLGQTSGTTGGGGSTTSHTSLCTPACATVRSCYDGPMKVPGSAPFDTDRCLAGCQREAEGNGYFEPTVARFMLQYVADMKDDPDCVLAGVPRHGHAWAHMSREPGMLSRLPAPVRAWSEQCVADWQATCPKQFEQNSNPAGEVLELCLIRYSRFRDPEIRRASEKCFNSPSCSELGQCSQLVPLPTPGESLPWY